MPKIFNFAKIFRFSFFFAPTHFSNAGYVLQVAYVTQRHQTPIKSLDLWRRISL